MGRDPQTARAMTRRLADGETLVVGSNVNEITAISKIVGRALVLAIIPRIVLAWRRRVAEHPHAEARR